MKSNIRVSLVFPRFEYKSGDPPLGIAYIASYLRANTRVEVNILDATFHQSHKQIRSSIELEKPDIVGIFTDTIMFSDAMKVAEYARDNDAFVVMGGPHVTVLPETVIDHVDVAVIGEGEYTFTEIVKRFKTSNFESIEGVWLKRKGSIKKNPRRSSKNRTLDEFPFPAFDLLEMDKYVEYWSYLDSVDTGLKGTTMITSRGCPFKCTYCQPTLDNVFGKKLLHRSPDNVVEEMRILKRMYEIDGIFFHDDTLTVDKKWLAEFCHILEKERLGLLWGCNSRIDTVNGEIMKMMNRAGLRNIHFGIESGVQRVLDKVYKKAIRLEDIKGVINEASKIGIHTLGFFMFGAPSETIEEIEATIELSRSLDLDEATFSITTPLIGTYLYEMIKGDNRYTISDDYADFNYYKNRAFAGDELSNKKLEYYQKKALFLFYTNPKRWNYVIKHLLSIKGLIKLFNKLRRFV
jgi:anaerobic magnesium-protoporphyrin IX monomethyl ester cyclase